MRKSSLSEDTLLRMLVAAIAETIARLAMLRTAGNYQQALQIIDQNLEELLGLKADLVRQLDDKHIVDMLTTNGILDFGRLYYVAELFRQEAEIRSTRGDTQRERASQIRALNLFLEVGFAVENEFPEADERIDELVEILGENIPEDTLFILFDYYEQVGAFDRAEASINLMLRITENHSEIAAEKKAFYERLLAESSDELEAGGLTREHIEQTYQQFL
jgi:tetratricopeptide (TPR) repeat protein